jgi:hypothetical protein
MGGVGRMNMRDKNSNNFTNKKRRKIKEDRPLESPRSRIEERN